MTSEFELHLLTQQDERAIRNILETGSALDWLYPFARQPIDVAEVVAEWLRPGDEKFAMICRSCENGEGIGIARIDGCQLAFAVGEACRGRGLATAMISRMLRDHVGPGRLEARVERRNIASQRVLQKTGFRFAGLEHGAHQDARLAYVLAR